MDNSTSITSPLATIKYGAANVSWQLDYAVTTASNVISNMTIWQFLLAILALCVVYDQCMSYNPEKTTSAMKQDGKTNLNFCQGPTSGTRAPLSAP